MYATVIFLKFLFFFFFAFRFHHRKLFLLNSLSTIMVSEAALTDSLLYYSL